MGPAGSSGDSSTTSPVGSSEGTSAESSSGDLVETGWCWSSEWVDASEVADLWTDDTNVIAACGSSIVTFDGSTWENRRLEDEVSVVTRVAARSLQDAWFGGSGEDQMLRLEGDRWTNVPAPLEDAALLSLKLGSTGGPWALVRYDPPCDFICDVQDSQLFHWEDGVWIEQPAAPWAERIDVAQDTVWAAGFLGTLASLTEDGWTVVASGGVQPFESVDAVSSTEAWITMGSAHGSWDAGLWESAMISPSRFLSATVDAAGTRWGVTKIFSEDQAVLERFDDAGRSIVAEVPDTAVLRVSSDADAWLGVASDGIDIRRVSVDGTSTVSVEYALPDIGDFDVLFSPGLGEAIGSGNANGLHRNAINGWSPIAGSAEEFSSVWGPSASEFFAVQRSTGTLWQASPSGFGLVDFPVEDPNLVRVWGSDESSVFAAGVPAVGTSGEANVLLVMHWDGAAWIDISPGVSNVGSSSRVHLHGAGEDLYLSSAASLHHYDGAAWTSVVAPSVSVGLDGVRAYAADQVFVVAGDGALLMHDGATWRVASDLWPELTTTDTQARLSGNATSGIFLSLSSQHQPEDEADAVWVYRGEGWEPFELPIGVRRGAILGIAEDGSQVWAEDGRRVWNAVPCE